MRQPKIDEQTTHLDISAAAGTVNGTDPTWHNGTSRVRAIVEALESRDKVMTNSHYNTQIRGNGEEVGAHATQASRATRPFAKEGGKANEKKKKLEKNATRCSTRYGTRKQNDH